MALSMKYIKRLKRLTKGEPDETVQISAEDLEEAGRAIIRPAQLNFFQEDIKVLARETRRQESFTKTHSSISKLDPFIDKDGILRVGGRLKHADIPDQVKHPVILLKTIHVTNLIVRCYHKKINHQGKGMTLNEIRSRGFWIIGGLSAVSSIIASCVTCRKLQDAVLEQKMSDLPEDRLDYHPPFTYCRVDYFGTFTIKEGLKVLKG